MTKYTIETPSGRILEVDADDPNTALQQASALDDAGGAEPFNTEDMVPLTDPATGQPVRMFLTPKPTDADKDWMSFGATPLPASNLFTMPGDLVKNGLIAAAAVPQTTEGLAPGEDPIDRARFAPVGRNKVTGKAEFPVYPQALLEGADIVKRVAQAFPKAWSGEMPMQEADPVTGEVRTAMPAIETATEAALLMTPMSAVPKTVGFMGAAKTAGGRAARTAAQETATGEAALAKEAGKAIDTAKTSGVSILRPAFEPTFVKVRDELYERGFDPEIPENSKVKSALKLWHEFTQRDIDFRDVHILRRRINKAAASKDSDARASAMLLKENLDDFIKSVGDMPEGAVKGGPDMTPEAAVEAFQKGIADYAVAARAGRITSLLNKAEIKSGQYSQSGMENAIRTVFRAESLNDAKMRTYPKDEQELIKEIASGGALRNIARWMGKASPKGIVSAAGSSYIAEALGIPKEAVWALGFVSDKVAEKLAVRRVQALRKHILENATETDLEEVLTPEVYQHLMSDPDRAGIVRQWLREPGNSVASKALAASIANELDVPGLDDKLDELSDRRPRNRP